MPMVVTMLLSFAHAQPQLALESFASGFTNPVDIAHAGDNRLFIVEQEGIIRILNANGQTSSQPFMDISSRVSSGGERGLLGLVFHPDYTNNGFFFVNYTNNSGATRISRFSVSGNPDVADAGSEDILLEIPQPYDNHNAGDLAFGPDGYLYIPLGDGGSGGDPDDNGQDRLELLGSILRIDVNGTSGYTIPSDNPFVNDANFRDEIWSWGWRNPWRFSFDRLTGDMWVADVGQSAREEVSFEAAGSAGGQNYGWRCYEGTGSFNLNGCVATSFVNPIFEYAHGNSTGRSITGGFVYRGTDFPALQGSYVMGDYQSGNLWTLTPDGNGGVTEQFQGRLIGRFQLSTFGEDQAGELYAASHSEGAIYKVRETTTSIQQPSHSPLLLGPLPWTDVLTVQVPREAQGDIALQLLDLQGRVVRTEPVSGNLLRMDRQSLPTGLYMLELVAENGAWRSKVVVR